MMRALAIAVLGVLGCSSSAFDVADNQTDSAMEGAIDIGVADSTAEDVLVDSGAAPDVTTTDTKPMIDSAVADSMVAVDTAVVKDTTPLDTSDGGCDKTSECATNWFCFKTGCSGKGTCKPLPSGISNYAPVCGCDGITYWNSFEAANYSMGVASNAPCAPSASKPCTVPGECVGFAYSECVFELSGMTACAAPTGVCWRMPAGKSCPFGMSGPAVSTCMGLCTNHCEAVKSKLKFFAEPCTTI